MLRAGKSSADIAHSSAGSVGNLPVRETEIVSESADDGSAKGVPSLSQGSQRAAGFQALAPDRRYDQAGRRPPPLAQWVLFSLQADPSLGSTPLQRCSVQTAHDDPSSGG